MRHNRSVNADDPSRPAAAPRRPLVAGYVRRYEGMVLSVPSKTALRPRTVRGGALGRHLPGVPAWLRGWPQVSSPLSQFRSMVLCSGRNARATAPASLAHVVGTSPVGAVAALAASHGVGAKAVFVAGRFAQPGAMPPCSLHHRRASATAAHNKSVNTAAQGRPRAARAPCLGRRLPSR